MTFAPMTYDRAVETCERVGHRPVPWQLHGARFWVCTQCGRTVEWSVRETMAGFAQALGWCSAAHLRHVCTATHEHAEHVCHCGTQWPKEKAADSQISGPSDEGGRDGTYSVDR